MFLVNEAKTQSLSSSVVANRGKRQQDEPLTKEDSKAPDCARALHHLSPAEDAVPRIRAASTT